LQSWYQLRTDICNLSLSQKCIEIDKWWQAAPLVNHYLHHQEVSAWPGPWELLNDNEYCYLARGLGMIYTLLLLGIDDIDFCIATDDNSEEVAIVTVNRAKYVLNYWPDSVLNNNLAEFKVVHKIDIDKIKTKL
jgi:hypothetical protein